ncbi:MAG: monovalent cation/H+ antiporter complex subunit F [Chloroflexi bacterium]|nr:monovalent cation/H+ antiporter complex subunit F [Chloroflexota bacterium]
MTAATEAVLLATEILIGAALLLTLAHLLQVRTLLGRVVALEVIAAITVGGAAVITILSGETAAIDVALAVALVSFTGTVAFAIFFEGWHVND